jgi:hypothetical protein
MGKKLRVFSACKALQLYEAPIENTAMETLPKVRRVWLAVCDQDSGGIQLVATNNNFPFLKLPQHHGSIIMPGLKIEGQNDHITTIIDVMKKDFGTEITPLVSKLGQSLFQIGREYNNEPCVFVDDVYITVGKVGELNNKQYATWHNHVHVGTLAKYALEIFHPTNGDLGVMPVMLMLAFAAIPLITDNFVEKYEVKKINGESFLTSGNKHSKLLNPTMYGNKFVGFEGHSNLITRYNQKSRPAITRY